MTEPVPDHPDSVPEGLVVALSRARIRPGMGEEATRWMQMLNDRLGECVATLDREKMAIEIVFRLLEDDGDFLYWVTVSGTSGQDVTSSAHPLDVDHLAFDERVRERGWVRAQPQLLLLPDTVRQAVLDWALPEADAASRG